ncbi:MAG TPA: hypothetical protein VGM17_05310 [Rhizomicrobium sp.]|jgi:hypothetical protein
MAEQDKQKHEELVEQLKQPGWRLNTGEGEAAQGTLEDVARAAHARKQSGSEPGLVQRIENAIELDLFDLEQLWWHMGLPT